MHFPICLFLSSPRLSTTETHYLTPEAFILFNGFMNVTEHCVCYFGMYAVQTVFLGSAVAAVLSAVFNFLMDVVTKDFLLCESVGDDDKKKKKKRKTKRKENSTVDDYPRCLVKKRHVVSAQRALAAVKTVWYQSNDMIENGFCERFFIPELANLNSGMTKKALNYLHVAPSVIRKGAEIESDKFFEFMFAIRQQRLKLKDDFKALKLFNIEWGLNEANGQFLAYARGSCSNNLSFFVTEGRVDQLVLAQYLETTKLSAQKNKQLSALRCSPMFDSWVGIHILHVFIADLIGRHNAAAAVFTGKTKQE